MLGTTAPLFLADDMKTYGLIAKRPPVIIFRFFWSARLSQDPGRKWLRSTVIRAYERINERSLSALQDV
ncbi:hypothetical protein [Jannaschia sp. CCS1]|uniref:hypothetical protein n=1 Tax=Jannaschia sp. (strain CCS1) TaxID=290400 RepID=UPI00030A11A5|nr:hypothetical protein [Jannaschia sp. CCS1]